MGPAKKICNIPCNNSLSIKKNKSQRGAALIELAIILSLFVILMFKPFQLMVKHFDGDGLVEDLQNAFFALQQESWSGNLLDVTVQRQNKEDCDYQTLLQTMSKLVTDSSGTQNICSKVLVKSFDAFGTPVVNELYAVDENGADCSGWFDGTLVQEFESIVSSSPENGPQYGIGVFSKYDPSNNLVIGNSSSTVAPGKGSRANGGPSCNAPIV